MMEWLAQLSFATPAALWALAALPLIWLLLRTTPPRPREVRFPPFRLLEGLHDKRRQPARTPWWLLLLRMALAAALILALAGPRLVPRTPLAEAGNGPWLVIVDDGWAAARHWPAMRRTLHELLSRAEQVNRTLAIVGTTPRTTPPVLEPKAPRDWRNRLAGLRPQALDTDRAALAKRLTRLPFRPGQVFWLSDGIDSPGTEAFMQALQKFGVPVRAYLPKDADLALALLPPKLEKDGLHLSALRPVATGPVSVPVILRARNGRPLAQTTIDFAPTATRGQGLLKVPSLLRNQAARLEIPGQRHAGAVWLLGDGLKRKTVLVISGDARSQAQPLLSPTYYVTKALAPYADVTEEAAPQAIPRWLKSGLSMLVLADVGRLPPQVERALIGWVAEGGMLVRFAGERIANASPLLLPVTLRQGERALGATLSWQQPQPLAAFAENSPFAGLMPDPEVRVQKQVLAEPDVELPERTWARLADGTPLITAKRSGRGWLVLVHVTAAPDWSNLPLSGLFVRMLKRLADLAPLARPYAPKKEPSIGQVLAQKEQAPSQKAQRPVAGAYTPTQMLTGDGQLAPMPPEATPIPAAHFGRTRPSPLHPAGLYARAGQTRALNVGHAQMVLAPLPDLPNGFARAAYVTAGTMELARPLFLLAAVLFLLDMLAMAWLGTGGRLGLTLRKAAAMALLAILLLPPMPDGHAQDAPSDAAERDKLAFAMMATRETHLAFVKTGDARVDEIARAGLFGLSEMLSERTSVEPGEPIAIDIEKDEIAFFPLLYWPVTADAKAPSPAALRKLNRFLKHGGTILFDTRDAPDAALSPDGMTPERQALRRILSKLDIPPLEPVPKTHVLTRTFFLLQSFPGRFTESPLWVEATSIGRERRKLSPANADGVSAILITGNDMAGAWAMTETGRPLLPVIPGGARQREYAYRAGINIVMYTLTGNYKADQVHLPTILKRLGQ